MTPHEPAGDEKVSKGNSPTVAKRQSVDGSASQPMENLTPARRQLWFSHWFLGFLLVCAAIAAYHPAWTAGFIWDDDAYITQNPLLTAPDGLRRIWFSTDSPSQYFPLVYTFFRLEHALWGFNAAGYHWVNILLHSANAWLVWRLLRRLTIPGAWFAAALFCLHPVQVETVAWAAEQKNILSLFFYLLALRAWVRFTDEQGAPAWSWYAAALACYVLALLSKTTACTLPAALVLVLWLRRSPLTRRRLAQVAPFVFLGLGMGLLTMWWERFHVGTQGGVFSLGMRERLLIASHAFWFYLGKLVLPFNLTFSYPRWVLQPENPLAYGWLVALLAMASLILYFRRVMGRAPEVALVFYLATLAPTLGFIMLFTFRYSFVADHYQYAACIGPLALMAAAFNGRGVFAPSMVRPCSAKASRNLTPHRLNVVQPGKIRAALCAGLLLFLGVLTWRQARIYQNVETLWRDTLAKNPTSWLAMGNLGRDLMHRGYFDDAIAQFQSALALNARDVDSLVSLGNAFFGKRDYEEAERYYQKALAVNPESPEAHINLAVILANRGHIDEAIEHERRALVSNPNHATAQGNLAVLLMRQGKYPEALEHYEKVLELNPEQPLAHINLGLALNALGRTNEAQGQYLEAGRLVNRHAQKLAQENRFDEAAAQYRETLRFLPHNAESHAGLGLVLEHQGRLAEAREEFKEALRLDPLLKTAEHELRKLDPGNL